MPSVLSRTWGENGLIELDNEIDWKTMYKVRNWRLGGKVKLIKEWRDVYWIKIKWEEKILFVVLTLKFHTVVLKLTFQSNVELGSYLSRNNRIDSIYFTFIFETDF